MAVSFGMLTTFPPTQCGLATFSQALTAHLIASGAGVSVVRVLDSPEAAQPLVTHQWVTGEHGGEKRAARALNRHDIVLVQHEYGIFGGDDGADVLTVLDDVRVPIVTVLHTVLTAPTPNQRRVLADVVAASSVVVTMTQTARRRLIDGWGVEPDKVIVIAHGAEANRAPAHEVDTSRWVAAGRADDATAPDGRHPKRPSILTWGLLGPGKGIEWAVEAMAELADLDPRPMYRIVGQTHPRVVEHAGEAYREALMAQVSRLGLDDHVTFDGRYLDGAKLRAIVRAADIILLPYDSREQVTSGVLTEAVVAGKPVVSTRFPHAVELLSDGAGLLVPQGDAPAIRGALRRLLTQPLLAEDTARAARALAPTLLWPAVAAQYIGVGHELAATRTRSVA
ncbi:MAG: glycosyltransferase [Candidatus Nanopelagicales bacterium]